MKQHLYKDIVHIATELTRKISFVIQENIPEAMSEPFPICNASEIQQIYDCCARQELGYHETYESVAANIIYHITKGHYLQNGNKRIATSLFLFYSLEVLNISENHLPLFHSKCMENNLEKLMIKVAESKNQEMALEIIEEEVRKIWNGFSYRD